MDAIEITILMLHYTLLLSEHSRVFKFSEAFAFNDGVNEMHYIEIINNDKSKYE